MSRRAARIASAIFINILAGAPLVMLAHAEPVAPDNCLASPQGETPAGSRWRYHTDHVNKRNCWYLRREDGSVAQAVPQPSQPAPAPQPQPAAKPSLADARAEFRSQAAVRDDSAASPPPANAANPVGAPAGNVGSANPSVWNSTAPVATRWPEMPPVSAARAPAPAAPDPATTVAQADAAAPAAASPAASFAVLPIHPEMLPTLIAAVIGMLVLAGLVPLVLKRLRGRVRRRKASTVRGPIWETTDDDRIVLSDYPANDDRDYRPRFARGVPSAASRYRAPEVVPQRAPRRARR
jgi:hypothetical protein